MKVKLLAAAVFSLMLIFVAAGCVGGSNDEKVYNTEPLGEFNKINITGVSELKLINTDAPSINYETSKKNAPYVTYEIVNGTLEIKSEKKVPSDQDTRITVWYKNLNEITIIGVHDVNADMPITAENLTVTVDGTNDVDLTVRVTNFTLTAAGVNEIDVVGDAQTVILNVDGTSDVDFGILTATDVTVTASGVSDIDVYASGTLNIELDGAATLTYAGNPAQVNSNVSAVSTVIKKN